MKHLPVISLIACVAVFTMIKASEKRVVRVLRANMVQMTLTGAPIQAREITPPR